MQKLSEEIRHHTTRDNVSILLTRFGQRYYVERVGPLGSKLSDVPHESLSEANAHFDELVEYHA